MKGIIKGSLLVTLGFVIALLASVAVIVALIVGVVWFLPPPPPPELAASPSWAPDGQRLAIECYLEGPTEGIADSDQRLYTTEAADICIIDRDGQNRVRLTQEPGADRSPIWSPDGSQLAYVRQDGIYLISADGRNPRRLVHTPHATRADEIGWLAWAPDKDVLLFSACLTEPAEPDVYLVDVQTGALTNLTAGNGREDIEPRWINNGAEIVFNSLEIVVKSASCSVTALPSRQLNVLKADGSEARLIFDRREEHFYTLPADDVIAIHFSNAGQIAFILEEVDHSLSGYLYTVGLDQQEPIQRGRANRLLGWSPDEKYLAYRSIELYVLNIETGEISELPSRHLLLDEKVSWSPDSQHVAVAGYPWDVEEEWQVYIFDIEAGSVRPLIQR